MLALALTRGILAAGKGEHTPLGSRIGLRCLDLYSAGEAPYLSKADYP